MFGDGGGVLTRMNRQMKLGRKVSGGGGKPEECSILESK